MSYRFFQNLNCEYFPCHKVNDVKNFNCMFCQNHEISHNNFGKEISIERLAEIFIELQNKKVNNINLVSPTPYVYQIIEAIKIAKNNGLTIPIIYNTNSYETNL